MLLFAFGGGTEQGLGCPGRLPFPDDAGHAETWGSLEVKSERGGWVAKVPMAGALRAAVRRVEKDAPIFGVAPLEEQLGNYLTQRRFQTSLLIGFSLVALLMAAVGIYGLIQYSIATRSREIGLRMAVGAQAGDIFRMIIGEGLMLSVTGAALGLVGALWLGRAGSSLLFGVTASDPLTFMAVSLLLTAVAMAACYFPARRAMRVNPLLALRAT